MNEQPQLKEDFFGEIANDFYAVVGTCFAVLMSWTCGLLVFIPFFLVFYYIIQPYFGESRFAFQIVYSVCNFAGVAVMRRSDSRGLTKQKISYYFAYGITRGVAVGFCVFVVQNIYDEQAAGGVWLFLLFFVSYSTLYDREYWKDKTGGIEKS